MLTSQRMPAPCRWLNPTLKSVVPGNKLRGCQTSGTTISPPWIRWSQTLWSVSTITITRAVPWATLCKAQKRNKWIISEPSSWRRRIPISLSLHACPLSSLRSLHLLSLNRTSLAIVNWQIKVEAGPLCLARFTIVSSRLKSPSASHPKRSRAISLKSLRLLTQSLLLNKRSRPWTLKCLIIRQNRILPKGQINYSLHKVWPLNRMMEALPRVRKRSSIT